MTKMVEAVYEKGALWPVEPLEGLEEHSRVRIQLETEWGDGHPLSEVIGTLSDEDADEMMRVIEEEFESVDARDWQ